MRSNVTQTKTLKKNGAALPLLLLSFLAITPFLNEALAQDGNIPLNLKSNIANRRVGLHNGNRIKTKFQNDGLSGSKTFIAPTLPTYAWPVNDNEYIYDLNIILGVEKTFVDTFVYNNRDTTSTLGTRWRGDRTPERRPNQTIPQPSDSPFQNAVKLRRIDFDADGDGTPDPAVEATITARYVTVHQGPRNSPYRIVNGVFEGLQPVEGFFNPSQEYPAMSHIPNSWPAEWPDQPTWKDANGRVQWNGYFGRGIFNADQESYVVYDDATDRRWFNEFDFRPNPNTDPNRYGVGFQVKQRGLQWSNFLAQDNIFWIYDIKNISEFDYEKVVFGSIVGTAVGRVFQANKSVFDQRNSITYTYNPNGEVDALWNRQYPVGYAGLAFLESPGNPYDGIDNDNDYNKFGSGDAPGDAFGTPILTAEGGLGKFNIIQGDSMSVVSRTGYDFYETQYIPDRGVRRGGNAMRIIQPGDTLIIITKSDTFTTAMAAAGYNALRDRITYYRRSFVVMPQSGSLQVTSLGRTRTVSVGDTVREISGNLIDDNYNGLIDEDYFLHVRRIKTRVDINNNDAVSYEPDSILHFKNYFVLARRGVEAMNDFRLFPMIDERRDDGLDNNRNWVSFTDDVGKDGRPSSGDFGERDGRPTAGESGFDAVDVVESDQIGLTSFKLDLSQRPLMNNSADLWRITQPGLFDTLQPPQDYDYTYGTGYFPLGRNQVERFSVSVVMGENARVVLTNTDIVQQIYDNNYNFAGPPKPEPTLTAVPGDRKVTLYWTNDAEEYFDSFINRKITGGQFRSPLAKTFEGYKIYKSTDPNFLDPLVITGGQGEQNLRRKPVAQFDKIDSVFGYFPMNSRSLLQQSRGVSFYLGDETGLQHVWTDTDVQNGRTYYYAVVAYSKGYIDPVNPEGSIFPSENSFGASPDSRGRLILSQNAAIVVPRATQAGLVQGEGRGELKPYSTNRSEEKVFFNVVNPRRVTSERKLKVEFVSTANDGLDNNGDNVVDDLFERLEEVTSFFRVIDTTGAVPDTIVKQSGLVQGEFVRYLGDEKVYRLTATGDRIYDATEETRLIDKTGIFLTIRNNGVRTLPDTIRSRWNVNIGRDSLPDFKIFPVIDRNRLISVSGIDLRGRGLSRIPDDYAIIIKPRDAARSDTVRFDFVQGGELDVPGIPTNFEVWNLTRNKKVRYFIDPISDTIPVSSGGAPTTPYIGQTPAKRTEIYLLVQDNYNPNVTDTLFSWFVSVGYSPRYRPQPGDTLFIRFRKPILGGDAFGMSVKPPTEDENRVKDALANVKVFPNPYIVANAAEGDLPAGARGRGDRKIFFKNVPLNSTIRIYTIRGELIRTLKADSPAGTSSSGQEWNTKDRGEAGTFAYPTSQVEWNLKTSENLDIAYGVYLYHIDAPGIGTKTGKFAVIK
ncbi:MAG: hypothetical protein RMM16_00480 [Chloroherpetonaceae bacterium]|nr:hypothetical protein [Chloroherpetonaceae bacterium]